MKRPTRIAAVVATTGLLMAAASMGVVSIQHAAASASAPAVVAEGPATSAAEAAAILGDPTSGPALPPIPKVAAAPQTPVTSEAAAATSVVPAPAEDAAGEHDRDDEREGHDD